jgi:hypothetical protein
MPRAALLDEVGRTPPGTPTTPRSRSSAGHFTDAANIATQAQTIVEAFVNKGCQLELLPIKFDEVWGSGTGARGASSFKTADEAMHAAMILDCVNDILKEVYTPVGPTISGC